LTRFARACARLARAWATSASSSEASSFAITCPLCTIELKSAPSRNFHLAADLQSSPPGAFSRGDRVDDIAARSQVVRTIGPLSDRLTRYAWTPIPATLNSPSAIHKR
jgi:hypothetical protein